LVSLITGFVISRSDPSHQRQVALQTSHRSFNGHVEEERWQGDRDLFCEAREESIR
jgi:hypothetical protein